jgi:hypothetical protein
MISARSIWRLTMGLAVLGGTVVLASERDAGAQVIAPALFGSPPEPLASAGRGYTPAQSVTLLTNGAWPLAPYGVEVSFLDPDDPDHELNTAVHVNCVDGVTASLGRVWVETNSQTTNLQCTAVPTSTLTSTQPVGSYWSCSGPDISGHWSLHATALCGGMWGTSAYAAVSQYNWSSGGSF